MANSLDSICGTGLVSDPAPVRGRLGRNVGGYRGETIQILSVVHECELAAKEHGWTVEEISPEPRRMVAFTRPATPVDPGGGAPPASTVRVYISTGIHGDEPAGPLAVRRLLQMDVWPPGLELSLIPCLNPTGFGMNRRENAEGLDLNRQYRTAGPVETRAHTLWLSKQTGFDLCLCLHEDWECQGFYLYELNPDRRPSLARSMVDRVADVCPIDVSPVIEGREAEGGVICPQVDPASRPEWPEAFFLLAHKTRLSYTLEAPSDFPIPVRVAALTTAVNAALRQLKISG